MVNILVEVTFIHPSPDGTYDGMFMSVRVSVYPFFAVFFSTCFDVLSWNFEYDFVLMYYRSSLSVVTVTLRHFLKEY